MEALLARWEEACARSTALRFVDICLRGFGQVMLQDNPLTGFLFLLAVAWGALAAGSPYIFIGGLLGLVAATLAGFWLMADAKPCAPVFAATMACWLALPCRRSSRPGFCCGSMS